MTKALILLSGGQDSTTSLYWAKHRLTGVTEIHALSLSYGQRHGSELVAAEKISRMAGVATHKFLKVPVLEVAKSALTDKTIAIAASGGLADKAMPEGLPTTFVPGRNLVFLAMAAGYAGAIGADFIVTGVCQTDYSGYPDCRREFIQALDAAIKLAWPSGVCYPRILTPMMDLTKAETVKLAKELPGCWEALAESVTCYNGLRPGCGACPACELRAKGFVEAGEVDPATAGMDWTGNGWAVASQDLDLENLTLADGSSISTSAGSGHTHTVK